MRLPHTIYPMLAMLVVGCGRHTLPATPPEPPPSPPHVAGALKVGIGRAELSMPPGPSTFGHGPDARAAEGLWTRTYCRVFYFETDAGHRLALIPCELPAMSALLQRHVAERTRDLLHVSQIMMTATHTHAGVGHYFGARQYTGIFSSRRAGYDDAILLRLADSIGDALRSAVAHARPATLSWRHSDDFWCFTRNRSVAAYRLNRPAFQATGRPVCTSSAPERAAIDPALDVLEIDAYDPSNPEAPLDPIGSLSFFAMHPTVLEHDNQLFGGDVFGVISRSVEERLRRKSCRASGGSTCHAGADPLHGVINTNEGDISPIWAVGDIPEAIRIGGEVARFVWERHPQERGEARTFLDSRYVEEDITQATFVDSGRPYRLCPYGQVGQGAARGASDHATSVAAIPMFGSVPPTDYSSTSCHAPKRPLLGFVSRTTRETGSFPTQLPLAAATLGDTVVAFVPGELTITAGNRLKRRMQEELSAFPGAPSRVVLAGLANEYVQYVTTAEEYQLQDYEGASTLFGPNSSRYFTNRLALLARSMFEPAEDDSLRKAGLHPGAALPIDFAFGPSIETGISRQGEHFKREHVATCTMPGSSASGQPPRLCMYWRDGPPGDVGIDREGWISVVASNAAHEPIRLCFSDPDGSCDPRGSVDDRGYEFQTRIHERLGDGWIWSTLFVPTLRTWTELGAREVRLLVRGAPTVVSEPFSAAALPPVCSFRQARLCTVGVRTEQWDGLVPPTR